MPAQEVEHEASITFHVDSMPDGNKAVDGLHPEEGMVGSARNDWQICQSLVCSTRYPEVQGSSGKEMLN